MTAAEEAAAAAEVARKDIDIGTESEAEAIQGPGNQSTNSTSKHEGKKKSHRQKKNDAKIKKGHNAEREGGKRGDVTDEASGTDGQRRPIPVPHFVHHLPGYPLIVEASRKMSHEKAFKFGAVHVGEPSDPSKGSTCVYLMPDFQIPDIDEIRKDEVLFLRF